MPATAYFGHKKSGGNLLREIRVPWALWGPPPGGFEKWIPTDECDADSVEPGGDHED